MAKTTLTDDERRAELVLKLDAESRRVDLAALDRQVGQVTREILALEEALQAPEDEAAAAALQAQHAELERRCAWLGGEAERARVRRAKWTAEVHAIDRRAFVASRRAARAEYDGQMAELLAAIAKVCKPALPLLRVLAIEDAVARKQAAGCFDAEHPMPGEGGIPFDSFFTTPTNFMKLLLHPALDDPRIQRALANGDSRR